MDITVEKKGPCLRSLKIAITPEEINKELDTKFDEAKKALVLPGFRKGKVPRKLIEKKLGKAINEEVKESLVREAYTKAVEENELDPIDDPEIDMDAIELKENELMEFEISVETRPEFELGRYKDLTVEVPPLEVTEEEVLKGVESVRARFASLKEVEGEAAKEGDYITAEITYSVEGEENLVRPDCQVNTALGIVDGLDLGTETTGLFAGKDVGDTVSFDIPAIPDHFTPESFRGRAAKVNCAITAVKRAAPPEMDENFFKMIGVATEDEFKEKVRGGVLSRKEELRLELIDERIIDKLLKEHSFELPEKVLEKQAMRQEFARKMEMMRMGLSREAAEEKSRELRGKNKESTERFLRYSFVFDKIAKKEKIFVTESDVEEELKRIAASRGASPEEIRAEFEENEMIPSLRTRIREDKIRNFLREKTEIVEKKPEEGGSPEETPEKTPDKTGDEKSSGEAPPASAES